MYCICVRNRWTNEAVTAALVLADSVSKVIQETGTRENSDFIELYWMWQENSFIKIWITLVFTLIILKGLHHNKYQPSNICSSLITLSNISLQVFNSVKYFLFNLISTTLNIIPVSIKEDANKTVFNVGFQQPTGKSQQTENQAEI